MHCDEIYVTHQVKNYKIFMSKLSPVYGLFDACACKRGEGVGQILPGDTRQL